MEDPASAVCAAKGTDKPRDFKINRERILKKPVLALNEFYNMNCMEGMRQFSDKYFDLAIVDPEYGRKEHGGRNRSGWVRQKNGSKIYVPDGGYRKKAWTKSRRTRCTLMNYSAFQKIKLYGAVITILTTSAQAE
ncbi:protein of unknown function [Ruminococcaceae bacterium BL-6]|nr:protein of unknown function [Ruminococcaceae bacterium BL-6]